MKKVVLVSLVGMLSCQSYAQTLGDRIGGVQETLGNVVGVTVDQSALYMELYAKKSILASIDSAIELNRAVGLDTLAEEKRIALPLVALSALYVSAQTYRLADFSLQQIRNLTPRSRIDLFVQRAQELETGIKEMEEIRAKVRDRVDSLGSELEQAEKNLATQTEQITIRIQPIQNEIADLERQLAKLQRPGLSTLPATVARRNSEISRITNLITEKRAAIATINSELNVFVAARNTLVTRISSDNMTSRMATQRIAQLNPQLKSHLSMISKRQVVRSALSRLGSATRGTLFIGAVLVTVAITSDVVILTVSDEDLFKLIEELESDIRNLEAVL